MRGQPRDQRDLSAFKEARKPANFFTNSVVVRNFCASFQIIRLVNLDVNRTLTVDKIRDITLLKIKTV